MERVPLPVSDSDVVESLVELVDAMIHCILYHRSIYPKESFERRQLYGTVVYMNRHPQVVEYIEECMEQFKRLLLEDRVMELGIPIMYNNGTLREMYRVVLSSKIGGQSRLTEQQEWYRLYDDCKAALLRLCALSSSTEMDGPRGSEGDYNHDDENVTFRVKMRVKGAREIQDWIVDRGTQIDQQDPSSHLPKSSTTSVIPLPVIHLPCSTTNDTNMIPVVECMIERCDIP